MARGTSGLTSTTVGATASPGAGAGAARPGGSCRGVSTTRWPGTTDPSHPTRDHEVGLLQRRPWSTFAGLRHRGQSDRGPARSKGWVEETRVPWTVCESSTLVRHVPHRHWCLRVGTGDPRPSDWTEVRTVYRGGGTPDTGSTVSLRSWVVYLRPTFRSFPVFPQTPRDSCRVGSSDSPPSGSGAVRGSTGLDTSLGVPC